MVECKHVWRPVTERVGVLHESADVFCERCLVFAIECSHCCPLGDIPPEDRVDGECDHCEGGAVLLGFNGGGYGIEIPFIPRGPGLPFIVG